MEVFSNPIGEGMGMGGWGGGMGGWGGGMGGWGGGMGGWGGGMGGWGGGMGGWGGGMGGWGGGMGGWGGGMGGWGGGMGGWGGVWVGGVGVWMGWSGGMGGDYAYGNTSSMSYHLCSASSVFPLSCFASASLVMMSCTRRGGREPQDVGSPPAPLIPSRYLTHKFSRVCTEGHTLCTVGGGGGIKNGLPSDL